MKEKRLRKMIDILMPEIKRFESIYRERFIKAKVIDIIQNFTT
jgi:hypothetical protein